MKHYLRLPKLWMYVFSLACFLWTSSVYAQLTADPSSLDIALDYGDSTTVQVTINNASSGTMTISGANLLSDKSTNVVALTNSTNINLEYARTIAAINAFYDDYTLVEINTGDIATSPADQAAALGDVLSNADVLLVPKQGDCDAAVFAAFGPILEEFASNGGTVIFVGITITDGIIDGNCIFASGLFSGNYVNNISGAEDLTILDPAHPFMEGIENPYPSQVATFYYNITNDDAVRLVDFNNRDVVTMRSIGEGQVVLIGHDYFFSNDNMKQVIANVVQQGASNSGDWLYIPQDEITLAAGESFTLDVEFNAANVFGGVYQSDLVFTDANENTTTVPCMLTVTGMPSYAASPTSLEFGAWLEGSTVTQTFILENPGTDSLFVTNIESSNPDVFTTDITSVALYGMEELEVTVTFVPDAIAVYTENLSLYTNLGDFAFTIMLSGEGLGAPTLGVSPAAINVTSDVGSGLVFEETVSITNTGEGPMDFNITFGESTAALEILVLDGDGVDGSFDIDETSMQNVISLIEANYSQDYELTLSSTQDFSDPSQFFDAYDVVIIPPVFDFNLEINIIEASDDILTFIESGGTVIFLNSFNTNILGGTGMMELGGNAFNSGFSAEVNEPNHPLAFNVASEFPDLDNYQFPNFNPINIEDGDAVTVVSQGEDNYGGGGSIAAIKNIGNGSVIALGYAYNADSTFAAPGEWENMTQILINSLSIAEENAIPNWITFTPESANGVGFPDGQIDIDITINAAGLLGGTYTANLVVNNNDPLAPNFVIPVTLVVIGVPEIAIETSSLDFGSLIIGLEQTQTITIVNPGTDSLFITELSTIFPDNFVLSADALTIPPQSSDVLTITFVPSEIQSYNTDLVINNNVDNLIISLTAAGQGAPTVTLDPDNIEVTLLAGEQTTETVTISNTTGNGPLEYIVPGEGAAQVEILSFTIFGNTFQSQQIENNLPEFFPNFNLTPFDSNNADDLEAALGDVDVLLVSSFFEIFEQFQPVVQNFVSNGGTLLIVGSSCTSCINESFGVLTAPEINGSTFPNSGAQVMSVNTDNPMWDDITDPFQPIQDFSMNMIFFDNATIVAEAPNYNNIAAPVAAYEDFGSGTAIYLGYSNWDLIDQNWYTMLANALAWKGGNPPEWLNPSNFGGTIDIGSSTPLDLTFDATGLTADVYTYSLDLETNDPLNPTVTVEITMNVLAFPQAIFSGSNLSCDGFATFQDLSVNVPLNWTWYFGDGNSSTEQNPSYMYDSEGEYTVSLVACNDLGCDSTAIEGFTTVNYAFTYCDTLNMPTNGSQVFNACHGVLYDTGGPNQNYQEGGSSVFTIEPVGATSIILTFNEFALDPGFQGFGDQLFIHDGPDANAPVLASLTGFTIPEPIESTTGAVTLVMTTNGYNSAAGFELNWDCIQVTAPPVPDFDSAVEGEECLGMIQFADLTSQFPDTWNWDFGDGSTSTEQNPLHQYLQDGTYSVTLEACNFIDCATYTMDVVVENTLFITWAIGTGPDTPILPGSPVLMQDQTEDAITWNWDFGNGNIAIGQPSPITFYQSEGFYDVSLTVTDVNGCSRSRTITIWVGEWIVGIADETEQANVKVAPNPAQDQVMLTYDFQGSRDLQVVVTDMVGRTISQISQTALNGYQTTLSFAGQPAGMYIVTLQSEVGTIQKQIIIQ